MKGLVPQQVSKLSPLHLSLGKASRVLVVHVIKVGKSCFGSFVVLLSLFSQHFTIPACVTIRVEDAKRSLPRCDGGSVGERSE